MTLVDIIHPSASIESRREALRIVELIFTNIVRYPSEEKYRTVKTSSEKWREHVGPAFYLFQFYEWLVSKGFVQDPENLSLYFRSDSLTDAFEALEEVRMLLRVYKAPVPKIANDKNDLKDKLLPFLRTVAGLTGSFHAGACGYTDEKSTLLISDDLWGKLKRNFRMAVLGVKDLEMSTDRLLPPGNAVVWKPLLDLLSKISLCELEEDMAVVDAERFDAVQSSSNNGALTGNSLQEACARRRVAERHKANFVHQEINKDNDKIHKEVHLVSSRLIADIASCMEQIATLEGDEGMIRKDRLEAKRLLNKFREDGDIEYLHVLYEEWAERLEEVKKNVSKRLVYSNPI